MDELKAVFAKLAGLHKTVSNLISGDGNFFDPLIALGYFERYAKLRDQLKVILPDLYSDIPVREIPVSSKTTDNEGRGFILRKPLALLVVDIEEILEIWDKSQNGQFATPAMKVTHEGVFFAGQYFDAFLRVKDILAQATQSISLIDGYVNENVLDILSAKDTAVEVSILTKSVSASLNVAATAFNRQYGKLSIRTSSAFHDRFVIIDDRDFYHFGASLKDLGNRGFMFSLIEESFVISSLRIKWNQEWANAMVII
jgi:hypothetical protein